MQNLLRRYVVVMVRSRLLSISVGAWMLFMVGVELVNTFIAISRAENLDEYVASEAVLSVAWVGAAFIARMVALAKIEYLPYFAVATSWLVCAITSIAHFESVFPSGGGRMYSLIRPDLLAFWCGLFVVVSGLRFIITIGVAAGNTSHEVDSYS